MPRPALQVVQPDCDHRKFRLLFVLEKSSGWSPGLTVQSELPAINARLFPFAQQMARRGHTVQVADVERLSQVSARAADTVDSAARACAARRERAAACGPWQLGGALLCCWRQVAMEDLDAIIFVKLLKEGFQLLKNSSVPLLWDHVDEW